ncbi:MFS transporter [Roseobacter sp. HKCCA0434]|uniref:MFS transporter n=1 Tax=Roseobacter sp. HKCCA0434 TaxID=3079297 RepID=UPI002905D40A|nr:MFS transporter [Roseobacter sp. HKCCA0434]
MTGTETFCPQARRRYVLMAAIVASAMGFIDGSVVSIAVPAMRESLDASLADIQWVNNAYMLTLSALILVGGAAGDRYGVVRVFTIGIALFVAASVLCALAPTTGILIPARALQGIGAAVMVPGSLALISKSYPRGERGRAIGIWAAASAVTTALGPVLGGALLSAGSAELWRAIFLINLPLGALALWMLIARVPRDRPSTEDPLDWTGAALVTLALGLVAWAMTGPEGEDGVPEAGHIALYGIAGLTALAGFIAWERRARHPMMPLRLFAMPGFAAANAMTFTLYFALSAVLFYLPMTLIAGWGISELQVTVLFLPLTLFIAPLSGPVGGLAERIGPAPLIGTGSALVALAYASLAWGIGWGAFWGHVLPSMALMGFGMALVVAPLSAAVMGAVEDADSGAASGVNNAISRMAGLVAVAAMGGVAAMAFAGAGGDPGLGFGDPDAGRDATSAGLAAVAWGTAGLAALSSVIGFTLLPWGRQESGGETPRAVEHPHDCGPEAG